MKRSLMLTVVALTLSASAVAQNNPASAVTKKATSAAGKLAAGVGKIKNNPASASAFKKIPGLNAKFVQQIIQKRPFKNAQDLGQKVKGLKMNKFGKFFQF